MTKESVPEPPSGKQGRQSPPFAFPGERGHLVLLNHWKGDDVRNAAQPAGDPGLYRVMCVLRRPGRQELAENKGGSADTQAGSSHLRVLDPRSNSAAGHIAVKFTAQAPIGDLHLVGTLNDEGCIGKIVAHRVHAKSFVQAEAVVRDVVSRWLSRISLDLDVPTMISSIDVQELSTGNRMIEFTSIMIDAPVLSVRKLIDDAELAHYAGLYREALNSNSPIYSFLCLFKIIEGTQARRERLGRIARCSSATNFGRRVGRLPSDWTESVKWLSDLFPYRSWDVAGAKKVIPSECLGKKVNGVVDSKLRPLRTRIAHAVLEGGELALSPDDLFELKQVERWIALAKCVARHLLRLEFSEILEATADHRPEVGVIREAESVPKDGVYESPGITGIQLEQHVEVHYPAVPMRPGADAG